MLAERINSYYTKLMKLSSLGIRDMPRALPLRALLGPSFILLGLGLGSGELILWPFMSSNYGMGIIWGAFLGITFQFFINMEIERYALVTGESVFVGLARKLKIISPIWFIFSTLVPWMWPGIIASSATVFASLLGLKYNPVFPIVLLVAIGLILTLGPVIYKTQEIFQRNLILVGVPFIFLMTLLMTKPEHWQDLAMGLVGKGENFWFLPAGISLATFLGAFAYAGAGGNLNLAQSFYIKEKGYGMGKFSGRITSVLTGKKEDITLEGKTFKTTSKNVDRFRKWWRTINIEHAVVFWATGAFTMLMLSLLAYATLFGRGIKTSDITFLLSQGDIIGARTLPLFGTIFLIIAGLMLFSTQLSVMDATSRIMCENLVISSDRFKVSKIPFYYYAFLWLQIIAGIIIFAAGFTQPLALVITGAVLNAGAMFVYSGLILWLNMTNLEKVLRPGIVRVVAVGIAFLFYGGFSIFTIFEYLNR